MKNQKEATLSTIYAVLNERGIEYEENGSEVMNDILTDADKSKIRETLFNMFREGTVSYKAEFQAKVDVDSELKKYVSGLLNNWVRKYKGFNCGEVYRAKNPGSRKFSGDEQMKALKALSIECAGDEEAIANITEAIDKRKAEINAEKVKHVKINTDALPEHLRGLIKE